MLNLNFVKIEFEVEVQDNKQFDLKLLPTFIVNFGYPYNDSHLVICKDSTDYLGFTCTM